MKDIWQYILEHWQGATGIGALLWELIVRLNPSQKSLSFLTLVFRIINAIIPDKNTTGGTHVIILLFILLSFSSHAQNSVNAKAWYSGNTQDTTALQTTRSSLQALYGNYGAIYYDKTRNKYRAWSGVCPDTSFHNGCYVDLIKKTGSGTITNGDNGLSLDGPATLKLGGSNLYLPTTIGGGNQDLTFGTTGSGLNTFNVRAINLDMGSVATNPPVRYQQGVPSLSSSTFTGLGYYTTIVPAGGSYNVDSDPMIVIQRTTDATQNLSSHGFIDATLFHRNTNGNANNSFSDNSKTIGTADYDHHAGFQGGWEKTSTGTLNNYFGFIDAPKFSNGTTLSRCGFCGVDATVIPPAVLNVNYGAYISTQTGGTTNWGLYVNGPNDSYLNGNLTNTGNLALGGHITTAVTMDLTALVSGTLTANSNSITKGSALFGTTTNRRATIDYTAGAGEMTSGAYIGNNDNGNMWMVSNPQTGFAGGQTGLMYYDGTIFRSAAEITNVASGFGSLDLMKSSGKVTINKNGGSPTNDNTQTHVLVRDASTGELKTRDASSIGGTGPAGSNTQIQFNNSGSFGATADLVTTRNPGTFADIEVGGSISNAATISLNATNVGGALSFGLVGSGTQLPSQISVNSATVGNGGNLTIEAGSSTQNGSTGGTLFLQAGSGGFDATGVGGDVKIKGEAGGTANVVGGAWIQHLSGFDTGVSLTTTAGAGLGTGGTATLSNSTDEKGVITLNVGTLPASSSAVATVNFVQSYKNAPVVVLFPADVNSGNIIHTASIFISSTATGFTINTGVTTLTASTTFVFNYMVIQ